MTWFKVDDSFHSHPKVLAADAASLGLWVVAGAWSSASLTDGFVPDHVLPRLLPDAARLAGLLVTSRLWKRVRGGYQFHDWKDYNPTSEQVRTSREQSRERMRNLREKQRSGGKPAGHTAERSREQPANVRGNFGDRSRPRPDPTRSTTTDAPSGPPGRTARPPEAPPSDAEPSRVEALITEYRDASPRGLPSRQAERLATEIHTLIGDGYTDIEIRNGLGQLRVRKLGPAMLPGLVDEIANTTGNVITLRPPSNSRTSTADQRVADTLALGAQLQAEANAHRKELGS